MKTSRGQLQQVIAANKFYPPRINGSLTISRHEIIVKKLPTPDFDHHILVIEAQAGQGKTTLAHQYLEYCRKPFVWYQIGAEDADPVLFLAALHLNLARNLTNFSSPQLSAILEGGQVGPLDLHGCANILLNDIDASLEQSFCIVLDDLHLLEGTSLTIQLIDYLVHTAPPRLHFILTSRQPLQLSSRSFKHNPHLVYLDSEDLALDLREIETLYRTVLKTDISRTEAREILAVTNGWIMGSVLAANPLQRGATKRSGAPGRAVMERLLPSTKDASILNYFKDEIFAHIPGELHETILKLSLLDEIDVPLARVLTGNEAIEHHLGMMANENFFVYRLDDQDQVFRFHHLFQEFLQTLGQQILGPESVAHIYRRTADYYLQNNRIDRALRALRQAGEYGRMEIILKQHGLELVAANRTVSILTLLRHIPEKRLLAHPWLTFYHGLLSIDFTPQQTLPFFESCRTQFQQERDYLGELMALSQIIYFHFVISGNYVTGSKLLARARDLFEQHHSCLPPETAIIVARNLAAGYCFFTCDMKWASHYAGLGCNLAMRLESKNFIAANRFILGYIGLLSGDFRVVRREIERSFALASDPMVGMSNRLTLHIMQLCALAMEGQLQVFVKHKDAVQARVDQQLVRQTIAAPYLHVWYAIGLIGVGKRSEALDIIEQGMQVSKTAASGHMTSQFLQWRAFVQALEGREQEALDDIAASASLREASGGPFFVAMNQAVHGATLVVLGQHEHGWEVLATALRSADSVGSPFVTCTCLAYLAFSELQTGSAAAVTTLSAWLQTMQAGGYSYFWGWDPGTMARLLSCAVKRDIEAEFATHCARRRLDLAITSDGDTYPLLLIKILGTFSIGTRTREVLGPQDLTSLQRELLGLLISSPQQRINQEQVQLAFWPDSPPDKARKSFDSLTSRLRKSLATGLAVPATRYITVEKGYVQLHHVSIDAVEFLHAAGRFLKHARHDFWWQAGNECMNALSHWSAFVPHEHFVLDQSAGFQDTILSTLKDLCLTWCTRLVELHRPDEAAALLEQTARLLAADEDAFPLRYHIYLKTNARLKARDLMDSYRQELQRLGYEDTEVEEIISALTERYPVH